VRRLAEHGIVTVTPIGRTRLVEANTALPWYRELRALLVQTVGPPALLASALSGGSGVDAAYIFGSWAARFNGSPGLFPRDIDLVVIGEPAMRVLNTSLRRVERALHVEINPVIVSRDEWDHATRDSFLGQIREGPLVPIPIEPVGGQ
jgi:predicted nucleotidyltransferase